MKGAGFAWIFGLMMVALVVAVFATGVVSHYNAQVMIVSSAVEAYDTVHVSEFTKRTLDGAAFAAAKSATVDLAAGGGGSAEWTNTTPNTADFLAMLKETLEQRMDLIEFNGLTRREITWGNANVTITAYDDSGFSFAGNMSFIVKSSVSTPQTTIWNQGAFEQTVNSTYFKLLRLGRVAAVCPAKEGLSEPEGFRQNITLTANNTYSVTISDNAGLRLRYSLKCE